MSLAATLGSRFALLLGGRISLLVLGLLTTALLTRILGPDGFGHFRTATAYLGIAIALADLGLASLFVREISRPGADQARIIGNALGLRLALAGLAMTIALALAFVLPLDPEDRLGILGGSLGFLAYSVHLLLFGLFQQKLRQGGVVLAEVSGGLVLLAAILVFAGLDASPAWFVTAMGLSYAFTLALTLVAAQRLVRFGLRLEPAVWWRLVRQAAPLAVAGTLSVVYLRADTVLLALMHPPAEVGLYGVPTKVFDSFIGIILLLVGLFAPLLANTARVDERGFRAHLTNALGVVGIGTTGLAVGIVAIAPEIVRILAGSGFAASVPVLQLLAGLLVLRGLSLMLRETATALAIQHKLLPAFFIAFAVAFAAYLLLIPPLGGIGAALSLLLAEGVLLLLVSIVVVRAVGALDVLRMPLGALGCGIGAGALAFWLATTDTNFVIRAASTGLAYVGLLLLSRTVSLPLLWRLGNDILAGGSNRA
jgi:O-antigen/teichoic acid export membrane protein